MKKLNGVIITIGLLILSTSCIKEEDKPIQNCSCDIVSYIDFLDGTGWYELSSEEVSGEDLCGKEGHLIYEDFEAPYPNMIIYENCNGQNDPNGGRTQF